MALLAGCSAIDNFDKFTVGGGCNSGCPCIAGEPSLGVPEHCAIPPSNGLNCTGQSRGPAVANLGAADYLIDTGATPPIFGSSDGGTLIATGNVQGGNAALFCLGSLIVQSPSHITVVGNRPLAIVADSVVRLQGVTITLAGGYAVDEHGAPGVAGGTNGGDQENAGVGTGGGHAGGGNPGTGGSGGGGSVSGAVGGSTMAGSFVPGGAASGSPGAGFGGGGGGKASSVGGGGGAGGGALQITASWEIAFDQVQLNASGGGGAGGGPSAQVGQPAGGGGGGGAGGIVLVEAPGVNVAGGCISVIGGPGGGGGSAVRGGDARVTPMCGFVGQGGLAAPGGGPGGGPGTATPTGGSGTGIGGGGGGAGGYGRVIIRSHNPPPANMAPGVVPAMAYAPAMLP